MNFDTKFEKLSDLLINIRDGDKTDFINKGFCVIVECYLTQNFDISYNFIALDRAKETWPKHSGRYAYPVPSPYSEYKDVDAAYDFYHNSKNHWEGEYGKLRYELLEHCIEELQKAGY